MTRRLLYPVLCIVTMMVTLSIPGQTQTGTPNKLGGFFDDFTADLDGNGPWQISGDWSLALEGQSGRADFSATLNMVRSDSTPRSAHTHHIMLTNGSVSEIANGFHVTGNATIAVNGNLAGFSGSAIDVQITGGNAVPASNIALTFSGGAAGHFGGQPLHGPVTSRE
jgi:hypothetical protein